MSPENLGPYLLFRLDMIDQDGGSRGEELLKRRALLNNTTYHVEASNMLAMRLYETRLEVSVWGESVDRDFEYVHQHFRTRVKQRDEKTHEKANHRVLGNTAQTWQ